MYGVIRVQVIASAAFGGQRRASADVVRVAVRVDHAINFEALLPGKLQIRMQVPQRIDQKGTKVEDLAGTGEQDSPGG